MGTWELSQRRLSLGGLLVFTAYLAQLYAPLETISTKLADLQRKDAE